jgi:branched-chain amino acid transport system permease protein
MANLLEQAKAEPLWHVNAKAAAGLAALALLLLLLPLADPGPFYLHLMILIFMYAVMAQSWNVIAGLSGQISLGHGMFFGIGAYASSVLYVHYGISPWLGLVAGMLICAAVAVLIGIPMLRLSGHYFAIATLLIAISCQIVFQRWEYVGAASGLWMPLTEESSWAALQFHGSKAPYYYVFLGFLFVAWLAVWRLGRSKIGFRLRAVRDDPQAAQSLGIDVARHKIIAYAISAMIMAPMGTLFAQYILIVDPDRMFNIEISILVLLMTVLGGIGTLWGPLLGVAILVPISEYSRIYLGGTGGAVDLIFYGLILMLICILRPDGLISLFPKHWRERERQR